MQTCDCEKPGEGEAHGVIKPVLTEWRSRPTGYMGITRAKKERQFIVSTGNSWPKGLLGGSMVGCRTQGRPVCQDCVDREVWGKLRRENWVRDMPSTGT